MPASPRVVAARQHAARRRAREQRALRLLSLLLLAVVLIPSLSRDPRPALHGAGLVVAIALAGLVAAFAVLVVRGARLQRDADAAPIPTATALIVMGAAGIVLSAEQPTGTGALALSLIAYVAGARLALRPGAALTLAITLGVVLALALQDRHAGIDVTTTVLLAVLLFLLARLYRRAQADRERAEIGAAELADARERELESAALAERARIARELHDVLAHSLSGLSLQLEGARMLAEREGVSEDLGTALARSKRLAADGLEEARRAVRTLRGDELPGPEELPALIESFRAGGLDVDLTVAGERRDVPRDTGLALFRGVQEALTNVVRHSAAGRADVRLEYGAGVIRLVVSDPGGEGAPGPLTGAGSGYGLSAMRERAELLGGHLDAGPDGEGFLVTLELPG